MPIYEYVCNDCGQRYERLVVRSGQRVRCPKCDSAKHTLQFSTFSAQPNGSKSAADCSPSMGPACGCGPNSCGCQ
jgi:putative FmdB family regulatory protein